MSLGAQFLQEFVDNFVRDAAQSTPEVAAVKCELYAGMTRLAEASGDQAVHSLYLALTVLYSEVSGSLPDVTL